MTSDADKKQQVAARIQRQMLREARQRLKEAQEALKVSEAEVENLRKKQDENTAAVQRCYHLEKTLAAQELAAAKAIAADTINKKDAMIAMLKRRVQNFNEEYNNMWSGRKATTLEDVHKLTGENE